jgi:arabinose-5-phosphate isomerase
MSTYNSKMNTMKEFEDKKNKKMMEISAIIKEEMCALSLIPVDDSIINAIDLIHTNVHAFGGKVIVTGLGKAGQIGVNIATTLSSTGTPAVFLHSGEAQHGDLGIIQKNDILFLISNSGKTREVVEFIELAHKLYAHLPVIVMTSNAKSPLALKADIVLLTGNPNEVCPLGLAPTTSTTVMTVIGDILIVQLMKKIKFTREEYARLHHGGYLSQKARGLV